MHIGPISKGTNPEKVLDNMARSISGKHAKKMHRKRHRKCKEEHEDEKED